MASRPASSSGKDLPAGVRVIAIDYTDVSAMAALFKEHATEVVISTISGQAHGLQQGLGDAAKLGGVKLFLPSDFGVDTVEYNEILQNVNVEFAAHLKKIGLPSARIFVICFALCSSMRTDRSSAEWFIHHIFAVGAQRRYWKNPSHRHRRSEIQHHAPR